MATEIILPTSRMIGGDCYKGRPRESNGAPIYVKGSNPPVQAIQHSIGIAIPKQGETHWNQTPWGVKIWAEGETGHKLLHKSPSFSWKIIDGDSNLPNSVGTVPCNQEGYAGNWVMWPSSNLGRPPIVCNPNGQLITEPDYVYAGCYVQVAVRISPNTVSGQQKAGVYVNLEAVCFIGHGERIAANSAINVSTIQWNKELPPGASPVPLGMSPVVQPPQQTPPGTSPVQPVPNYAILQPPAPRAKPPAPRAKHIMTERASGYTYEQMIEVGWTDDDLRESGMMI